MTSSLLARLGAAVLAAAVCSIPAAAQQTSRATTSVSFNRANMDTTCAACTDFYEYANGGWLKDAKIPADRTSLSSFGMLSDRNLAVVHRILDEDAAAAASGAAKRGTNAWKIGTFYGACMDTAAIAAAGIKPIEQKLAAIAKIANTAELVRAFSSADRRGGLAPFNVFPTADPKNSSMTIVSASQGGLGLPDREYYLRTDPRSEHLRAAYQEHVARTLQLIGEDAEHATADAAQIVALETSLARQQMSRAAMRDPNAVYHKMSVAQFSALTPHVDWHSYLTHVGGAGATEVDVRTPAYFQSLDTLLTTVPLDDWKAYLRWRVASSAAPALGPAFVNEDFEFAKVMRGVEEQEPRWRYCQGAANGALGWAIGQQYVKETFTPAAKARAAEMVDNLVSALRDRIRQLDWMSDATKQQAVAKLNAFRRKVAYPDTWRDYATLTVRPGAFYDDVELANQWNQARAWARVGKPVDKTEWSMTPPTVNASYSPSLNQIQFPAGILQPPFFDPKADDAVNYGAMGAVIGHEMSHGFDDQGRQFDAQGNLRDWWTPADAAKYKVAAQRIVDQFNGYTVIDSATHVNGHQTLGENIGDLGGLTVAYAALEKALAKKGRPGRIDGFTPEQRFFLSWAQIWREVQRPEAERLQVNTNPHSPGKWRVDGPLSNMPEFREAFGCKEGDAMVRPDSLRARIW